MWSGIYLALFALAAGATYIYVVKEEAVVFTSAIASGTWSLLAITGGGVDVVSGGETVTMSLGSVQYLFAGLSLLSLIAFVGSIIGWYPTDPEIHNEDYRV